MSHVAYAYVSHFSIKTHNTSFKTYVYMNMWHDSSCDSQVRHLCIYMCCVTRLVHVWDMTHLHVWHYSERDMTHSHVWHYSERDMTHSHVWHYSERDMTHLHVWHYSERDMTHLHVWHYSERLILRLVEQHSQSHGSPFFESDLWHAWHDSFKTHVYVIMWHDPFGNS